MCTAFRSLSEALAEMETVISLSAEMWGEPLTNGAVQDSDGFIVWRQRKGQEDGEETNE